MGSCKGRASRAEGSAKALRQDRLALFKSQKENLAAEGGVGRTTEMSLVAQGQVLGLCSQQEGWSSGSFKQGTAAGF